MHGVVHEVTAEVNKVHALSVNLTATQQQPVLISCNNNSNNNNSNKLIYNIISTIFTVHSQSHCESSLKSLE